MKQSRATLFGLPNSPEAYELRDFLKRSGFPFEWIDLKTDDDARRLNPSFNPLHPDNGISYLYEEPYSENRDLVLSGVFLEPAKLRRRNFRLGSSGKSTSIRKLSEKICGGTRNRRRSRLGVFQS